MDWNARVLVICDGSLASVVACVAAKEASLAARPDGAPPPPRPVAWIPAGLTESQQASAALIGQTYGLEVVAQGDTLGPDATPDLVESTMLVHAVYAAAHRGCPAVFWPAHAPGSNQSPDADPDLNTIARIIDKALLVGRLCALDAEHHNIPAIRVEAPYADLNTEQIADLARDLEVKLSLCWWWEDPAGAAEKARWTQAFEKIRTPVG